MADNRVSENNAVASEKAGRTALITGASAGLGVDFAHEFGKHGFNLVLVARRKERLDSLAQKLKEEYAVDTTVIASDLSLPDAAQQIVDQLAEKQIHIDALVNNAGYALSTRFSVTDWKQHADFIQVLATSVLQLTHLLIPAMKKNKYGRILNVASIAAFTPDTSGSLYDAIKTFILRTTISLDLELRPYGIYCAALCPGLTHTEFHEAMGVQADMDNLPAFMWMDSKTVAAKGYDALMNGKVVSVDGFFNRFAAFISGLLPLKAHIWISRKSGL